MRSAWFDAAFLAVSIVATVVFLFVPLGLLASVREEAEDPRRPGAMETGVGVAVILRVAARRLLRAGARNVLQTTTGTFTRTASRALTRRMVRIGVRSLAVLIPGVVAAEAESQEEEPRRSAMFVVALGFVTLAFSFAGILWVVGPDRARPITSEVPLPLAALLSALPLLAYALLVAIAARWHGVETRWQTGLDGLLLQGYFTGAGSFLPLTTDVDYRGTDSATTRTSVTVLGGLFALHLLCRGLGAWQESAALSFTGAMFLLYAFIYSFPIRPLDGHYLWSRSKLLWFVVWLVLLVAFVSSIPESFNGIL